MFSFSSLRNYLRPLSPRRRQELEYDIAEEIRFHLEMRARDNEAEGMDADYAEAAAVERFGDVERIKDECLAIQEQNPIQHVLQFGQALVTLTLGFGALLTIFILINAALLQPLRFEQANRLVSLRESSLASGDTQVLISMPNYRDWKATTQSFEALTVFSAGEHNLTEIDAPRPVRVRSMKVAADFFEVFGVEPLKGRIFTAEEENHDVGRFVLLSHTLWAERYGSDESIIGKSVVVDGYPAKVLGVMPDQAQLSYKVDIWVPQWTQHADWPRSHRVFYSIGRLKDGVTLEDARAELAQIAADLADTHPASNAGWSISVQPLQEFYAVPIQRELYALLLVASLLLLMVLAGLFKQLLARALLTEREHSRSVSRLRRLGESLTESVLIALLGGVLGLLLAQQGAFLIDAYVIGASADLFQISLDRQVWAFALTLALGIGLFMGLAPSALASYTLRQQATSQSRLGGASSRLLSRSLGVATVALALLLLIPFGMMLRSYSELHNQTKGFDAEQLVRVYVPLTYRSYNTFDKYEAFYTQARARLEALPEIEAVSLTHSFPGIEHRTVVNFVALDSTLAEPDIHHAPYTPIATNYFETMGIPVQAGRSFAAADTAGEQRVAIISASLAQGLWPDQNPLGKSIDISVNGHPRTVIGIVGDVAYLGPRRAIEGIIYTPRLQAPPEQLSFVVRTVAYDEALETTIREVIASVDPTIPIAHIASASAIWNSHLRSLQFYITVFGIGASLALVLAVLAIYRIIADAVQAHRRQLGMRLAFGAKRWHILGLALRPGLEVLAVGLAIGISLSFLLIPPLNDTLIGLRPEDPVAYISVAFALVAVTLLAGYIPARRATQVDPLLALRYN